VYQYGQLPGQAKDSTAAAGQQGLELQLDGLLDLFVEKEGTVCQLLIGLDLHGCRCVCTQVWRVSE
jgi:hypothetical protein